MHFSTFILKNVFRRKVRSALTILGVAIAIGAVVALVGLANGFEQSFRQLYEGRGVDLMVTRAGSLQRAGVYIDQKYADEIRQMPGVKTVILGLVDLLSFEDNVPGSVQGWEADSPLYDGIRIPQGRRLHDGDRKVVMIGIGLAKDLPKKVGETLNLYGKDFQVVGVFEGLSHYERNTAVLPLTEMQEILGQPGRVSGFQIVVERGPDHRARVESIRRQVEALTDAEGKKLLAAYTTEEYVKTTTELQMVNAVAWVTSVIALIIGTVGILNTMIMSVFERTKEIGILRAIGWRRGRVIRMILFESLLLTGVGAVLGTVGAVVISRLLSYLPQSRSVVAGEVAPHVMLLGLAIALVVGLVGGAYPAFRGARLLPTEALRHE